MTRPVGVDLFSGAGGLSLAFEQAGFDVAAAVEIDPVHAAVHKFNFPQCTVFPQSVEALTGAEIRHQSAIGRRKVEVVFGGAPCQGFSLIGARALDDPRNGLVRHFVRLVKELDANFFVFENVKGITVGEHVSFLNELAETFSEYGYEVRLPWKVLNAADFLVPQNRERLFLMGCKKGKRLPSYPLPSCQPAGTENVNSNLRLGPSCHDALADLPNAEDFDELLESDSVKVILGEPSVYAQAMRCLTNDAWGYGYQRVWNSAELTSSIRTNHSLISRRRFAATEEGVTEPISRLFKLPAKGISHTLRAGTDSARGAFTSPRPIHYLYSRCTTVREMARLHGFPDWFRFHVTKWHGARQIGNAVPPPLGRAVADQIMAVSNYEPVIPKNSLNLGDVSLLKLNPAEAAEEFSISAVGKKRDRKGIPKRRQWDDQVSLPLVKLAAD